MSDETAWNVWGEMAGDYRMFWDCVRYQPCQWHSLHRLLAPHLLVVLIFLSPELVLVLVVVAPLLAWQADASSHICWNHWQPAMHILLSLEGPNTNKLDDCTCKDRIEKMACQISIVSNSLAAIEQTTFNANERHCLSILTTLGSIQYCQKYWDCNGRRLSMHACIKLDFDYIVLTTLCYNGLSYPTDFQTYTSLLIDNDGLQSYSFQTASGIT